MQRAGIGKKHLEELKARSGFDAGVHYSRAKNNEPAKESLKSMSNPKKKKYEE